MRRASSSRASIRRSQLEGMKEKELVVLAFSNFAPALPRAAWRAFAAGLSGGRAPRDVRYLAGAPRWPLDAPSKRGGEVASSKLVLFFNPGEEATINLLQVVSSSPPPPALTSPGRALAFFLRSAAPSCRESQRGGRGGRPTALGEACAGAGGA